jgi:hydrogenase expression/formation protein HypE
LVAIVEAEAAQRVLDAVRQHPLGREAELIGSVDDGEPGMVRMTTCMGTTRIVDMLSGDQLPRIC